MYDNLRQQHTSILSAFSLTDGSGHSTIHHSDIFSAPTEEMMQCFMTQPNQFLIATFIGMCLVLVRTHAHVLDAWIRRQGASIYDTNFRDLVSVSAGTPGLDLTWYSLECVMLISRR